MHAFHNVASLPRLGPHARGSKSQARYLCADIQQCCPGLPTPLRELFSHWISRKHRVILFRGKSYADRNVRFVMRLSPESPKQGSPVHLQGRLFQVPNTATAGKVLLRAHSCYMFPRLAPRSSAQASAEVVCIHVCPPAMRDTYARPCTLPNATALARSGRAEVSACRTVTMHAT